jgi:hypothetical protein
MGWVLEALPPRASKQAPEAQRRSSGEQSPHYAGMARLLSFLVTTARNMVICSYVHMVICEQTFASSPMVDHMDVVIAFLNPKIDSNENIHGNARRN